MITDAQALLVPVIIGVLIFIYVVIGLWNMAAPPQRYQRCTDPVIILTGLTVIRRRRQVHLMVWLGGALVALLIAGLFRADLRVVLGLGIPWLIFSMLTFAKVTQSRCPRCDHLFHGPNRGKFWGFWQACNFCRLPLRATEAELRAEDT